MLSIGSKLLRRNLPNPPYNVMDEGSTCYMRIGEEAFMCVSVIFVLSFRIIMFGTGATAALLLQLDSLYW